MAHNLTPRATGFDCPKVVTGPTPTPLSGNYNMGAIVVNTGSVTVRLGGDNTVSASNGGLAPGQFFGGPELQDLSIIWHYSATAGELSVFALERSAAS